MCALFFLILLSTAISQPIVFWYSNVLYCVQFSHLHARMQPHQTRSRRVKNLQSARWKFAVVNKQHNAVSCTCLLCIWCVHPLFLMYMCMYATAMFCLSFYLPARTCVCNIDFINENIRIILFWQKLKMFRVFRRVKNFAASKWRNPISCVCI